MRGSGVLVVDDNPANLKLLSMLLRVEGFEVRTAVDARAALESVREQLPELIYTDVQLPDMDGLTLAATIKADPATAHVIIVALTALAMPEDRRRALDAGCDGYVAKPIDTRSLGDLTRSFLRAVSAPGPAERS